MRAASLVVIALLSALPASMHAQANDCQFLSGDASRVCAAAIDATRALHPILGGVVSGGNPILGSVGPLGGPGRVSLTARVNAVEVVLPDLSYDGSSARVPAGDKVFAPAPQLEAALGVYGGLPSGLLAVDLLASAQLLPTSVFDDISVESGASHIGDVALGFGYGARVGILKETGPLPGVSVSVMRREIPTITYGNVEDGDEYQFGLEVYATNLRLVAGKSLGILGLAGGVGWDKYTGDASIRTRTESLTERIAMDLSSSRAMLFLDASLDLTALKIVGEAAYQTGKDQNLTTDFEDFDTTKGKFIGGLGLRLAL